MKKYLLPENGEFYKANLHCHTSVSDGGYTPLQVKEMYKNKGYSIVAFTDHDVLVPHPELNDDAFLALNGYEIEINDETRQYADQLKMKTCHLCLIAIEPDNVKQVCFHRSKYLFCNAVKYADKVDFYKDEPDYERHYSHEGINDIINKGREKGFFVTYNHPAWSLENYNDYMGYNGMHAMEIFNSDSGTAGHCDYDEKEYDDMLRGGKRIFCIAADDNHGLVSCFGGFIMIKAEMLDYRTITEALLRGDFYASQGPLIKELWFEDDRIHITCSDAKRIILNTDSRHVGIVRADEGKTVNEASFEVRRNDVYVRLTVEDEKGKRANTNAYFADELFG
ncbi:MAG: PHP domain-containing protein [Clostridia bacterium]|nr:PHP domain-containing protein [Clostridia bacterium]